MASEEKNDRRDDHAMQMAAIIHTLSVVCGKWKVNILFFLTGSKKRFSDFKKLMPDMPTAMLSKHLKQLENDQLIARKVYNEIPPRVEYSLTEHGESIIPLIESMRSWGASHMNR
jgi:DNA-binding HxlR family transcriptional regulator